MFGVFCEFDIVLSVVILLFSLVFYVKWILFFIWVYSGGGRKVVFWGYRVNKWELYILFFWGFRIFFLF